MQEEKNIIENLFTKASIKSFEEQINTVPENYFDQFPVQLLAKVQQKKKAALFIQLGKLSIAASFLLIVAGSYLWTSINNTKENTSIAIHEIPTEEIDSYVSNYEWMADAEMQSEINKLGLNLEENNQSKDSID